MIMFKFRKIHIGILLMLVSSCCICIGQLLWKLSVRGNVVYLITGFFLYGIGAFIMIAAYKFGSLSILQPMLCMNYVFAIFIAKFILGEAVTITKIIGIVIIMISVGILGCPDKQE